MSSGQTPLNMELWFRVQQEYYLRQREDHLQQVEGLPSFVPRGSWKSVFTSEELRSRGLMSFISLTDESDDYTWKRVSGELNGRGKMVILWIILCHGSLTMLDCFKTLEICDSQLPIDSHLARAVFADTVSGDVFYEFQFAFSARVLREGYFAEVKEPSRAEKRSLMPYMEEYPLGRGAYGVVAAVRIYSGHIQYEGPGRPQSTESTILARKKLIGNEAGEHYSTELHFINWLQQIREKPHRNIMTPFCGYGHFVNNVMTWNVFYERAQCSLNDYLAHDSHFPMTSKSRLEHIRQMVHVAEALQWLAAKTESWRDGFVESSYYHCDLNPNNILVCVRNDSPNGLIFKIGDFGRALRHSRPLEPGRTHNRDGSSAVRVHSFESMCSAPEMSGSDPFVDQKTDVWSFGCVLLLVLVFNTYGVAAVAEFIASLARRSDDDSFWLVEEGRWKSPTLKTEVLNCMQQLRDLTQDNTDGAVVDGLLTMLKKEVFQTKPKSRAKIDELLKQMQRIYASKDQVMPKEEARTAESDYLLCAQSPQGEFELFHGRRNGHTLFIWRFGWVGPLHKLRPMSPPTTDTVTTPRTISYSDSCGNDKICQVISNRDLFEVLLYSIPTPPHTRVIRDFITLFGFDYASSIALSPDGNFLAIDTTTNNTRRLRLFDNPILAASGAPRIVTNRTERSILRQIQVKAGTHKNLCSGVSGPTISRN
ncbi:serine/threonine protein kinase [Capronia epimyces CBS 606.96]|uniref:Serine/threonine protein kinase n=1 Tax=Capronia epimyces CBS 606.96 TaxID=1182542 RepID=W9Y5M8_9EURO|nr:serine/threonine protein kinase [Capronia epimyces CBS 606.96]EXJ84920.1 serine/threonine protein kinase [Capronia epimyces CBS 606.96]